MAAPLGFTVRRKAVELLAPAEPTPRELKRLSDIDDQDCLRYQTPGIQFYRRDTSMSGRDPAKVVRDATTKALVHYYPFAGRLMELQEGKLAVECTGEGILFIEADANVRLEHFGDVPQPPFLGLAELLFDVPGSSQLLGTPLLLLQVTRLLCGGFILAVRLNHTMADAQGLMQFLTAVAELARGAEVPSVIPVWDRELLEARNPSRPCFAHREYDNVPADIKTTIMRLDDIEVRSFFFGAEEVAAVRSHLVPGRGKRATTFEVLMGCLWKCRTMALAPDADEEMQLICVVNARGKGKQGTIPRGYYGNALAFPMAVSYAGDLCTMPLNYAVRLVNEAKGKVDMEYMRSVADLMVQRGRPHISVVRNTYLASDVTRTGLGELDFGWGSPVYGGPANIVGIASFLVSFKSADGKDGTLITICLPAAAMDKFVQEISKLRRPAIIKYAL